MTQRNGFGITGLVLGILSFAAVALALIVSLVSGPAGPFVFLAFIVVFGIPTAIVALAAVIFGAVGIARGRARGIPYRTAIWGTVLGGLVILFFIFLFAITSGFGALANANFV